MNQDGWTFVVITKEQHDAIRAAARPGYDFKDTAIRMPDGRYKVPLQSTTVKRIIGHQMPNETIGDTILRACNTFDKPLN